MQLMAQLARLAGTKRHHLAALLLATVLVGCGGGDSDPVATVVERAQGLATTWATCAAENQLCSFSGTRQVRFGTATTFVTKTFTGSVACSRYAFGEVAVGATRQCWVSSADAYPMSVCASEGVNCALTGTQSVHYGTSSQWVSRRLTGAPLCGNTTFGDPLFLTAKQCRSGSATQPAYSTPQIFMLGTPNITVTQGQDATLKLRFYAGALSKTPSDVNCPNPYQCTTAMTAVSRAKVGVSLFRVTKGADGVNHYAWAYDIGNHYRTINVKGWSGYAEYSYIVNFPLTNIRVLPTTPCYIDGISDSQYDQNTDDRKILPGHYVIGALLYDYPSYSWQAEFDSLSGAGASRIVNTENDPADHHYKRFWIGEVDVVAAQDGATQSHAVYGCQNVTDLSSQAWLP